MVWVSNPVLIIFIDSSHLAANPVVGGRLLRLAKNVIVTFPVDGVLLLMDVLFFISFISEITADQYRKVNTSVMVVLSCLPVNNQLLLNTDDKAKISKVFNVFMISIVGSIADVTTNNHVSSLAVIVIISKGIDFCHVMRKIDFLILVVLIKSINHR